MFTFAGIVAIACSICHLSMSATEFTSFALNGTNTGQYYGASFCPVFDDGINVTCLVWHGDDTGAMWLEQDYSSTVCSLYNYSSPGYKNVTAYCVVGSIFASDFQQMYIGVEIKHLIVEDTDSNIFIPMTRIDTKTIQVTYDEGTDVMANATLVESGLNLYLSYNGTSISPQIFHVSGSDLPGLGQHATEVIVWNPLSTFKRYLVFAVADVIEGYTASMNITSPYIIHVDDSVTFTITTTNGSDIIYATEVVSTAYLEKTSGHSPLYQYTHNFNETGSFEVILSASNYVSVFENSTTIKVQYPVNMVSASAPMFVEFPTIPFTLEMDASAGVPMGTLNARIETGGSVVSTFNLTGLSVGVSIVHEDSSLPAGTYIFFVSIYSETTSMNFTFPVTLMKRIPNLDFLYQQEAKLSDQQLLGVRLQNPADGPISNMTCVFNVSGTIYTEILSLSNADNGTVSIIYPDTGINQLSVNCSNMLNYVEMTGQANVTSDCFEVGNLFSADYKNELTPLSMYITNDNTVRL